MAERIPEGLPPRIEADILIDGEVSPETLHRHILRCSAVVAIVTLVVCLEISQIISMVGEGAGLWSVVKHAAILSGIGFMGYQNWSQRRLLLGLLSSAGQEPHGMTGNRGVQE